jgi:hypothetical protein
LLQTSLRLPSGQETGYGLGWDLESVRLAGEPARTVGHDGDALGGMVAPLMTVPEHGIVVAVTSNISYADTFSLASNIAQAFADRHAPIERLSDSHGSIRRSSGFLATINLARERDSKNGRARWTRV